MNNLPPSIDPKVLAMPTAGLEDYVFWCDGYQKLSAAYLEKINLLKQIQALDPSQDYSARIEEAFGKAIITDIEWEIKRRAILARWLRDNHHRL